MRPLPGEFSVRRQAALRPSLSPFDGRLLVLPSVEQGRQLIERKSDVGAQLVLDAHTHLWRETMPVTVDRGSEPDTIVIHVGLTLFALGDDVVVLQASDVHCEHLLEPDPEAHHLEPARVGERGARPVHERTQPTCLVHQVAAGLQVQVQRVRQDCLGA